MVGAGVFALSRNRRNGNAPLECSAADGKIAQAAADEIDHFIAAALRANEAGMLIVILKQAFLKSRELEKIVLFRDGFRRPSALRTRAARTHFRGIQFIEGAVLACVIAF